MSIAISAYPSDCLQSGGVESAPGSHSKNVASARKEGAKKSRYLEMAALLDVAAKDPPPLFDDADFASPSPEEQSASDRSLKNPGLKV